MRKQSYSSLNLYQRCRRAYRYRYIQGIEARKLIIPLVVGKMVHAYLERWRSGFEDEQCELAVKQEHSKALSPLHTPEQLAQLEIERERAIAIGRAYTKYYANDKFEYTKFLTEQHFEVQLDEGIIFQGYIDCMAQDAAGDWWIIETKTASSSTVDDDYFQRIHFDAQVMSQAYGAAHILGSLPRGILYDVCIKTQHRRMASRNESLRAFCDRIVGVYEKEAETKGLFRRQEFIVHEQRVNQWLKEARFIAVELKAALDRKEKIWPKNSGACKAGYTACDYLPICVNNGKVDKVLFQSRK